MTVFGVFASLGAYRFRLFICKQPLYMSLEEIVLKANDQEGLHIFV